MTTTDARHRAGGSFPPDFPEDLSSGLELGWRIHHGRTAFRIFAPRASSVTLVLFENFEDETGAVHMLKPEAGGTWALELQGDLTGRWYGYRIAGPSGTGESFDPSILVADPYSTAVTTLNTWRLPSKTLIAPEPFDWGDDRSPAIGDPSELVIYECHVRDMTVHPSAGSSRPGTYAGLAEKTGSGGLSHLLSLGVNAVELMPVMKFGTLEIPYMDPSARTDTGRMNDWNRYARNHWGYMTSFFFAPETYYAEGGSVTPGAVNGRTAAAGAELRSLVRALHREGIAVILDVVYNHTSHYDDNPLRYADKPYYYRSDPSGRYLEASGCGNDFHTERPMARRLIVDSVRHWLTEYRVDGFRFDLAAMIDAETCRQITRAAREVKRDVVLIAEPWGGGEYHPRRFTELGWWSWNDGFRNAVKGSDPHHRRGFLFGERGDSASHGTTAARELVPQDDRLALNYLESHDGYTLGDFIRLACGNPQDPHTDPRILALEKLAALSLLSAPGPVMLHAGQEFSRSKRIAESDAGDPETGKPDHNSYNKDDATNWLDFGEVDRRRSLFEYYRGLIALRRRHPELARRGVRRSIEFRGDDGQLAVIAVGDRLVIILNASPDRARTVDLPGGAWSVLADAESVKAAGRGRRLEGSAFVPATSGMILMRRSR